VLTALVVVVLFALLCFAIYQRGFAGYMPAPMGLAVLHRGEFAFIESVAEVFYPAGAGLPVCGIDAQLPLYIDRHLAALPRTQRFQIRALFAAMEHMTLVFPGDEIAGRRRFSSLTAASRISILGRLANHPNGLFRLLITALRSVFVLGYLGHPANLHHLGLSPFEIEPAVSDAELIFPRIGGLVSSVSFELGDRTDPASLGPLDPHGQRHRAYSRAAGSVGVVGQGASSRSTDSDVNGRTR
jgi:hypothetical protein